MKYIIAVMVLLAILVPSVALADAGVGASVPVTTTVVGSDGTIPVTTTVIGASYPHYWGSGGSSYVTPVVTPPVIPPIVPAITIPDVVPPTVVPPGESSPPAQLPKQTAPIGGVQWGIVVPVVLLLVISGALIWYFRSKRVEIPVEEKDEGKDIFNS